MADEDELRGRASAMEVRWQGEKEENVKHENSATGGVASERQTSTPAGAAATMPSRAAGTQPGGLGVSCEVLRIAYRNRSAARMESD